jgi:hypothetical protein
MYQTLGLTMAQVVSHRPLVVGSRVYAWVSTCGICGRQSETGTGFSVSSLAFSVTMALHTHISSGERTIGGCSSETLSSHQHKHVSDLKPLFNSHQKG